MTDSTQIDVVETSQFDVVEVDEITADVVELAIPGPPGTPGGDSATFVHTQDVAASTWTIAHGLNRYPAVAVFDTLDDEVEPDVAYPDLNTTVLTFSAAIAGIAYLN